MQALKGISQEDCNRPLHLEKKVEEQAKAHKTTNKSEQNPGGQPEKKLGRTVKQSRRSVNYGAPHQQKGSQLDQRRKGKKRTRGKDDVKILWTKSEKTVEGED